MSNLWNLLINPEAVKATLSQLTIKEIKTVKAKDPAINGTFEEPVRKGRKPEVSKNHPAVLECRQLCIEGYPLHRVSIMTGVDYMMLARWYEKGWMQPPKTKRSVKQKQQQG